MHLISIANYTASLCRICMNFGALSRHRHKSYTREDPNTAGRQISHRRNMSFIPSIELNLKIARSVWQVTNQSNINIPAIISVNCISETIPLAGRRMLTLYRAHTNRNVSSYSGWDRVVPHKDSWLRDHLNSIDKRERERSHYPPQWWSMYRYQLTLYSEGRISSPYVSSSRTYLSVAKNPHIQTIVQSYKKPHSSLTTKTLHEL